jgi:hypothetical protein
VKRCKATPEKGGAARSPGSLAHLLYYHRLLTHRGLTVPRHVETLLAILGVCCMQDTPARWVAVHRRHHEHSDQQPDPHSPLGSFLWGHVGWMLFESEELTRLGIYERYAKDIVRDRFQRRLERYYIPINLASWLVFFAGGFIASLLQGGTGVEALQFGASLLVWGVFVRTVLVWHITWSVNSVAHLWGYRITRRRTIAATAPGSHSSPAVRDGTTTTMPTRARRGTDTSGGSWTRSTRHSEQWARLAWRRTSSGRKWFSTLAASPVTCQAECRG